MHPFLYSSSLDTKSPSVSQDENSKEKSKGHFLKSPKSKEDRRRLAVAPPILTSNDEDEEPEDEDEVYGKVVEYQPTSSIKVHDPTRDIYNILRSRKKQQQQQQQQQRKPIFGNVRYRQNSSKPSSYMDKLESKLRPPSVAESSNDDKTDEEEVYGVVRHRQPSVVSSPLRPFDRLRMQQHMRNSNDETPGERAFDIIRQQLMSTSARKKLNSKCRKGLRRKNSKKRRRNVSWTIQILPNQPKLPPKVTKEAKLKRLPNQLNEIFYF